MTSDEGGGSVINSVHLPCKCFFNAEMNSQTFNLPQRGLQDDALFI